MKRNTRNIRILAIVGMLGLTGSLRAQQSADTPSPPAGDPATSTSAPATTTAVTAPDATAPAPTAATAPAATLAPPTSAAAAESPPPSADLLKQARLAGYRAKLKNGAYTFCKSDASTGSRFVTEQCFNQETISIMLERVQAQRDELQHSMGCSGGSTCGGSK